MARKPQDAPDLLTVEPSTPIRLALSSMGAHDVSQLPVVMGGECVGSVREGELQSQVIEDPDILDRPVEEVMEAPYPVVDSYIDATELRRLLTRKNGAVLVREDGQLGGIVTRFDVVRDLSGVT
jgi:cystathionine beta-synthase